MCNTLGINGVCTESIIRVCHHGVDEIPCGQRYGTFVQGTRVRSWDRLLADVERHLITAHGVK